MKKEQITVNIDKLKEYDKNNKIHNREQIDKLKQSIEKVGYVTNIYVDKDLEILAGHGRKLALKELGYKDIEVTKVTGLTEDQKKKYRLLDNKIAEYAEDNMPNIEVELEDLDDEFLDMLYIDTEVEKKDDAEDVKDIEQMDIYFEEHNDYIMFVFEDMNNFLSCISKLNIKKVNYSLTSKRQKVGIGRVLQGEKLVEILN